MHLADIHIGSSQSRTPEYKFIFDKLRKFIADHQVDLVLVCGDVFHNKIKLTPTDIELFYYFIDCLGDRPTVIIPGNHDANLNNTESLDLISPLVAQCKKNIVYSRNTEMIEIRGRKFYHLSLMGCRASSDMASKKGDLKLASIDSSTVSKLEPKIDDSQTGSEVDSDSDRTTDRTTDRAEDPITTPFLLYHGSVSGAMTDCGAVMRDETPKLRDFFRKFDIVFLGDIHKQQAMVQKKDSGAVSQWVYPGSLIQQNLGESATKGFLYWDLDAKTYKVINVKSPWGFLNINLSKKIQMDKIFNTTNLKQLTANIPRPEKILKILITLDKYPPKQHEYIMEELRDIYQTDISVKITDIVGGYKEKVDSNIDSDITSDITSDTTSESGEDTATDIEETSISTIKDKKAIYRDILTSEMKGADPATIAAVIFYHENIMPLAEKATILADKNSTDMSDAGAATRKPWVLVRMEFDNILKYGPNNIIEFRKGTIMGIIADNMSGKSSIFDILVYGLFGKPLRGTVESLKNWNYNTARIKIFFNVGSDEYYTEVKLEAKPHRTIYRRSATTQTFVNMTDSTLSDNNKVISSLIGKFENFMATTLMTPDTDLVRMSNAERKTRCMSLFGFDVIKALRDISKKELAAAQDKLAKFPKAKLTDHDGQISALRQTLKNIDIAALQQAEAAALELHTACIFFKPDTITADISQVMADLSQLQSTTAEKQLISQIAAAKPEYDTAMSQLEAKQSNLADLLIKKTTILEQRPNKPTTSKYNNIKKEYSAYQEDIKKAAAARNSINVAALRTQLGRLEQSIRDFRASIPRDIAPDITQAKKALDEFARCKSFKYNANCAECATNMASFDTASRTTIGDYNKMVEQKRLNDCATAVLTEKIATARADSDKIQSQLSTALDYDQLIIFLNYRIHELDYAAICDEVARANDEVGALEKIRDKYERLQQELVATRSQRTSATTTLETKLATLRRKQEEIEASKLIERINKCYTELQSRTKQTSVLQMATTLLSSARATLASANTSVIFAKTKIQDIENDRAHLVKSAEVLKLEALEATIQAYSGIIRAKGFSKRLVKLRFESIIASANQTLRQITSFSISSGADGEDDANDTTTDDKLDFYITDTATQKTYAIELGSGYQKFIISLALRMAFVADKNFPSGHFLLIDEGFGCIDKYNMEKIMTLFESLDYNFIFIISHIEELNTIINAPLTITVNTPTESHINNTKETPDKVYAKVSINQLLPRNPIKPVSATGLKTADAKIMCECGASITKKSLAGHIKTQKHLNGLRAAQLPK